MAVDKQELRSAFDDATTYAERVDALKQINKSDLFSEKSKDEYYVEFIRQSDDQDKPKAFAQTIKDGKGGVLQSEEMKDLQQKFPPEQPKSILDQILEFIASMFASEPKAPHAGVPPTAQQIDGKQPSQEQNVQHALQPEVAQKTTVKEAEAQTTREASSGAAPAEQSAKMQAHYERSVLESNKAASELITPQEAEHNKAISAMEADPSWKNVDPQSKALKLMGIDKEVQAALEGLSSATQSTKVDAKPPHTNHHDKSGGHGL